MRAGDAVTDTAARRKRAHPEVGSRAREIGAEGRRIEGRGKDGHDVCGIIEQENDGGMIHGVVAARELDTIHRNTEVGREPCDRLRIARQPLELRVEGVHVGPEHGWGIPLRIDTDEQHPRLRGGGVPANLRELQQRRRAYIRTVRESEEDQRRYASEIAPGKGAATRVDELKVDHRLRLRQPCAACQLWSSAVKLTGEPEAGESGTERGSEEQTTGA